MSGSSIGKIFRLTTYGESHGKSIGGMIEGCPAGFKLNLEQVQMELDRRKPGQSQLTTQRKEEDKVIFQSGIFEGYTTGTPIGFQIKNKDAKSKDYHHLKDSYRPSHADFVYQAKYGQRDYRGGGRASARETACRVVAGAIAKQILQSFGVDIYAYVKAVGEVSLQKDYRQLDLSKIDSNQVRCPDEQTAKAMISLIEKVKKEGDSVGGIIEAVVKNCPIGLGEPVFDKLHADLAKAMLSINAVKGFEYGSGFQAASMRGSAHNDAFIQEEGKIRTKTNWSGGIQGGISNGEDIYFRCAFKPVATIMKEQESPGSHPERDKIKVGGRHDPCVLPRAVPIVSAMTALVLLDHYFRNRTVKMSEL